VAKRIEQDISAVCGAFVVDLRDERIVNARFAFWRHGGYPARALHAEACSYGNAVSETVIEKAAEALSADFKPLNRRS